MMILLIGCALALASSTPVGPSDAGDDKRDSSGGQDSAVADTTAPVDANRPDGGGGFDLSGFDISAIDISAMDIQVVEYEGTAEDGVVCGESVLCDPGVTCCTGLGAACDTEAVGCSGFTFVPVACDGNEDCDTGQTCCGAGESLKEFHAICVDVGTCTGLQICVTGADCGVDQLCCSVGFMTNLGLDMGWCETGQCGQ